jgi:hypothetical protein
MRRAAMRAAVKCRTAAVDGGYVMVAVWKSDLVGSDQLGGGLTPTGQMPSDDPKSGFADQGGKFPDRSGF